MSVCVMYEWEMMWQNVSVRVSSDLMNYCEVYLCVSMCSKHTKWYRAAVTHRHHVSSQERRPLQSCCYSISVKNIRDHTHRMFETCLEVTFRVISTRPAVLLSPLINITTQQSLNKHSLCFTSQSVCPAGSSGIKHSNLGIWTQSFITHRIYHHHRTPPDTPNSTHHCKLHPPQKTSTQHNRNPPTTVNCTQHSKLHPSPRKNLTCYPEIHPKKQIPPTTVNSSQHSKLHPPPQKNSTHHCKLHPTQQAPPSTTELPKRKTRVHFISWLYK